MDKQLLNRRPLAASAVALVCLLSTTHPAFAQAEQPYVEPAIELSANLYVGYGSEIGSFEYSVAANAYLFPDGQGVNYGELQANLSKTLGPVTLGAEVARRI